MINNLPLPATNIESSSSQTSLDALAAVSIEQPDAVSFNPNWKLAKRQMELAAIVESHGHNRITARFVVEHLQAAIKALSNTGK